MIPKSLVLVENANDASIFKAVLAHIKHEEGVGVNAIASTEDYIEFLGDIKPDNTLIASLKGLYNDFTRGKYARVGIVLDMDKSTEQERVKLVNNALHLAYSDAHIAQDITKINQFIEVIFDKGTENEFVVNFACHFIHIAGKGELEDLLMAIKGLPSPYADCLYEGWKPCFEQKGRTLSDDKPKDDSSFINHKEMQKFYIDVYKRFDVLPRKKKREDRTLKWDNFLKDNPKAFDFGKDEVVELKALKDFLRML